MYTYACIYVCFKIFSYKGCVANNLQINNKTYNFLYHKVHLADWIWQGSVGFCWTLVFIANLWLQLIKEGSWFFPVTLWSKSRVKQWKHIPELHLFIKHLCELDSIRRIISLTFHLIQNIATIGTSYFINIFSISFLSLDNLQNKNQTMIYRVVSMSMWKPSHHGQLQIMESRCIVVHFIVFSQMGKIDLKHLKVIDISEMN